MSKHDVEKDEPTPTEAVEPEAEKITVSDEAPVETPVAEREFPSLEGEEEIEITKRSPDPTGLVDTFWRKTFVVFPAEDYENNKEYVDAKNKNAVLNEAIANGVHPKAEPTFEGTELEPDGVSLRVNYKVEVDASAADNKNATTVSPSYNRE